MAVKRKPVKEFRRPDVPRRGHASRRLESVIVRGTKGEVTLVHRHSSSGRFTSPASAAAIDSTVSVFGAALKSLAKK